MSRSTLPSTILLILSMSLSLVSRPALTWGDTGRVEVRITDHRAGIEDFTTLEVGLATVSLHPQGSPRGQGWVEVLRHAPPIDIVPLKDGRWATVGAGSVPAARYDAVKVQFGTIRGVLWLGKLAKVVPRGSTVVTVLAVEPGTTSVIFIDLYVEDQREHHAAQYAVKIKAIWVEDH